jgi:hypothetical protein
MSVAASPPHSPGFAGRPLPASGERLKDCDASVLANLSPLAGRGRIALAIRVRGSLRKRHANDFEHPFDIAEHVIVPEAKHTIAVSNQPLISHDIRSVVRMLAAIDLDHQAKLTANEIHRVRPDRLLPDEFAAVDLASTQAIPEFGFGIRRGLPQAPGSRGSHSIGLAHVEAPLTRRFAPTSPRKRGEVSTPVPA